MSDNQASQFCWYEFCRCPWLFADHSWLIDPSWLTELLNHQAKRNFSHLYHQTIAQALNLETFTQLTTPPTELVHLNPQQRQHSCLLAAEIIAPGSSRSQLNEDIILWCRRTHAALRVKPPKLRSTAEVIGIHLLQQWQSDIWSRLCWLYNKQQVIQANSLQLINLSNKTADTLWYAILWQVQNNDQQKTSAS